MRSESPNLQVKSENLPFFPFFNLNKGCSSQLVPGGGRIYTRRIRPRWWDYRGVTLAAWQAALYLSSEWETMCNEAHAKLHCQCIEVMTKHEGLHVTHWFMFM